MAKTIKLDHITKIEGHAQLIVKIDKGKVKKVEVNVVEGARFFEAIVKGRKYDEVSVLTSRICGTCSPIHVVTALKAVENAFNVQISEQTKLLRELIVLGSLIQNHICHCYFLVLPDYLGYESAVQMASKYKEEVKRALRLKGLGNEIVAVVGGREVHPMTPRIGGFSKLPEKKDLDMLLEKLRNLKEDATKTVLLFKGLKYPRFLRGTRYFALKSNKYDYLNGSISCVGGAFVPTKGYETYFKEYFTGSAAKHVVVEGKSYMVGALARLNNNYEKLSKDAKKLLEGIDLPHYSPFMNIVAQTIEVVNAFDRCIEILENLELKEETLPKVEVKSARGIGVSEAPRGLLFHDYIFDNNGLVIKANIITPTAQNLSSMEDDIKEFLPTILNNKKEHIILNLEKLIRAYDPCISCSAHFLEVKFELPEVLEEIKKFHGHLGPYVVVGYRAALIAKNYFKDNLSIKVKILNKRPDNCIVEGFNFLFKDEYVEISDEDLMEFNFYNNNKNIKIKIKDNIKDIIKNNLNKENEEELAQWVNSLKDEDLFEIKINKNNSIKKKKQGGGEHK